MTILVMTFGAILPTLLGFYFVVLGLNLRPRMTMMKLEHFIKISGSVLLVFAGTL